MIRYVACWCIAALVGSALPALAQQTFWVTSEMSKVHAEKRATSKTLEELATGAEVRVLDRSDRWYRVRTAAGKEGWMYRGRLSDTKPAEAAPGEMGNLLISLTGSQITADKADTARSIRGLSKETEEYAQLRETPEKYREALDRVLARAVTETELETLLREGKIGEYAP